MMITKITPVLDFKYWLKSSYTTSLEPTIQNAIKVPKDFEPTEKKKLFLKLWVPM